MVDQQQFSMEEIKCIVRSIAISGSSKGLTARDLARDFKNMEGYDLPFRRLGFASVEQFLFSLKDTVRVNGFGPTATVEPVVTQSNKHIRELVIASKTNNNSWNRNKKSGSNSYRPKTYNNGSNYNGRSSGNNYSGGSHRTSDNGNANYRDSEPRKVINSEFDYYDADAIDENGSESSDDEPKFTMNGNSRLEQVQEVAPTSKDAIPDSDALDFVNSLEVPSDAMNIGDKIETCKVPANVVPKASIRVFVTEVHNPNRLWYHVGDNVAMIDDMMNEIEAYYAQLTREEWRLKPGNARVGFYCMAKYHGQWHRAKIVSEYEHNKLKVFYIDYGTVALVELRDLKYMAKIFSDVPAQAMRASLAYVKPVNHRWTRDASWSLLSLVFEKLLYAYVVDVDRVDNILHVVLIDTSGPQDHIINQQLFVKGHAVWEDDLPYKEKSVSESHADKQT
uniref:Tudor domain-containing protein 5 n=1 Tax=Culex tarsalis TaxID=7177 RepID=A0A1Q3EVP5_CULTA